MTGEELIASLRGESIGQQQPDELQWLLMTLGEVNKVLEIGTAEGRTMRMLSKIASPNSLFRCIDPDIGVMSEEWRKNADFLRSQGHDVDRYYHSSGGELAWNWAKQWAPYDLIFIDGDHSYEGVVADFSLYHRFGERIAFHDINHPDEGEGGKDFGVNRFWNELKHRDFGIVMECCVTGYYMGIGIALQMAKASLPNSSEGCIHEWTLTPVGYTCKRCNTEIINKKAA